MQVAFLLVQMNSFSLNDKGFAIAFSDMSSFSDAGGRESLRM
ncbi:hypothetical protein [Brevibacillus reuszeri]|nr:hypothetical protein [Brevibacillus reuszeri]